jgi:hypothetical protein
MKRLYVLFIIILSAAVSGFALPATDARFLNMEISYRLNNDGSSVMEYQHQVRLDTYLAVNRALGETFIVYNPAFQKLEILKAETTMADGRKVAAPENAFNEVLPFAAHGFADFSGLREMVVTHTGLERGAVVDLRYRIYTQPGFFPVFSGREILVRTFPIDRYRLTVAVPAGLELRCRVFGLTAKGEFADSGTEKRFVLALADLRPDAHETLAPGQLEPFVVFSNAPDWDKTLALASDGSPLPATLAGKVDKLREQYPASSDLLAPHWGQQSIEMLAALQKIVAAEVQNCGLGSEATGWLPRPLERVAMGNYGTRLEKALLLRALLKRAGIASALLAVANGADFAPEVPAVAQIGEYWLEVANGPHPLYLDPCQEQQDFFPYRVQGWDAWNLDGKAMEKLPATGWEENGVDISGTVQLDPAGASGTLLVAVRGIFNRYEEAAADSAKFVTGLLKKVFPVEKAEVKKMLLLTRREFRAEASFSGKWFKEAGSNLFSADSPRLPGLMENMASLEKRGSPLALEAPFKVNLDLDLQPAPGLRLEYAAPGAQVKNEVGYFSRGLRQEKNGHIRFSEGCAIEKTPVPPELYLGLREMLKAYFVPDFWLVLKKSK